MNLKKARERVWEMKAMLARGDDPGAWKSRAAAMPSFGEFVEEQYLPFARATVGRPDVIVSRLNTGALPYFRERTLDSITIRDVQMFHVAMKEKVSPTTANRHLLLLKRILGLAVLWELITKNPASE